MTTPVPRPNPFPGLRPFDFADAYLFFGRDGQSDEILRHLERRRFLAIVGASGSGKSSLIRAGLLPYLHGGFLAGAGSHWRVAIFRPGSDPIGNLAQKLGQPDVLGTPLEGGADLKRSVVMLEATLRQSGLGVIEAVRLARLPERENLLIIVDQFEELFRFADASGAERQEDDAAAFVKLLLEATRQTELPIYVVLTMRSDFIGDCARFQGLPEAVTAGMYLIPRMTREQRRAAIEEPVRVGKAQIARRLVNRLLNDVGDNPDQLPILQHALMRTWDYWEKNCLPGQPIDLEHYEKIGTMSPDGDVEGALSIHADEAYEELPDQRHREIAKRMFQSLAEKGADNREVRRPATVAEIAAVAGAQIPEVIKVIEYFRRLGRSFLMPPSDVPLDEHSVIDVSHESLIRGWRRLKEWVDEEARSASVFRRLAQTAVLHARGEADLYHDPELQIALNEHPTAEWAKRYHADFEQAMAFLEESREVAAAKQQTEERRRSEQEQRKTEELQRARTNLRNLGALSAVALVALIVAVFFGLEYKQKNVALARMNTDLARTHGDLERKNATLVELYQSRAIAQTGLEQKNKDLAIAQTSLEQKNKDLASAQTGLKQKNKDLATAQTNLEQKNKDLASAQTGLKQKNKDLDGIVSTSLQSCTSLLQQIWDVAERQPELTPQGRGGGATKGPAPASNSRSEVTSTQPAGSRREMFGVYESMAQQCRDVADHVLALDGTNFAAKNFIAVNMVLQAEAVGQTKRNKSSAPEMRRCAQKCQ